MGRPHPTRTMPQSTERSNGDHDRVDLEQQGTSANHCPLERTLRWCLPTDPANRPTVEARWSTPLPDANSNVLLVFDAATVTPSKSPAWLPESW
jgi:hypothetical protein